MLAALELNGFKSFADRTRLEFPKGITVVVGPNGSGKSNVVDAIKWVLGAQSVKALRGKEMTDVIFSGSRDRRPAGAAEASLIFDNSAGLLDHDAAEIQITRRVYRSGEGEYLINRQTCRLRDVRDLLGGVGAATGAYNIIEQGKVDGVLQATPKERRLIFEEAAGVSRFRLKREEAARRLERVQQNLLRLADMVGDLEGRLKAVRSQAGKAQRYSELASRLESLRKCTAVLDWTDLTAQIDASRASMTAEASSVASLETELAEATACVANRESQAGQLQRTLYESVTAEAAIREQLAQAESTRASHLARIDELSQETERLTCQLATLASRAGDTEQLVADTHAELAKSQGHWSDLESQLALRQQELTLVDKQRESLREELAAARAEVEAAEREAVGLDGEVQLLDARRHSADQSLLECEEQAQPLDLARRQLAAEVRRAHNALDAFNADVQQAAARLKAAQQELSDSRRQLTALHRKQAALDGKLTGARERTNVLEELERRLEGLTSGAKEVLRLAAADPNGPFSSVRGVVADLLQVDADTAPLVETALGDRAAYLVVTETKALTTALAAEPASWPGRTSFLRLDVPAPASAVDRLDLSGEPGVMGRADQFVDVDPELEPMVRRLLGRHWLVDTLATALRLASGVGRGLNFVTASSEAVLADGTLTVGPRHSIAGLLSRRSELRALREQIVEMESAASAAGEEAQRLETAIAVAEAAMHGLTSRHETLAKSLTEARLQAASLSEKLQQADDRLAELVGQRTDAENQRDALSLQHAQARERRDTLRALADARQGHIAELGRRLGELDQRHAELQRAISDERVELARNEQRVEGLRSQAEQLLRDHAERDRALDETRARTVLCGEQQARLQACVSTLNAELASSHEQRKAYATRIAELETARQTAEGERSAAFAAAESIRSRLLEAQLRMQSRRVALEQIEQQRAALADRIREDYQTDLAALAAGALMVTPADQPIPADRGAVDAEISDLRERLQACGPVNLEALSELEDVESRHGALATQLQDLEAARTRLEQIIRQINAESRQLFADAVEQVRGHFQDIFRRLFAGGEADVVIEPDESGDLLECGVSIIARPPGKQPRSITLLSGGERTLTCVALLLAIFKSRPSPFCVLDEVDAALDEANIDRFVGVLKEFMHTTQFIVITHSKRTMSCADTLHGVTMQQSGVSKRVSVRFDDVTEDGQIRPAALKAA